MRALRQWRGCCCPCAECCFATWVIQEGSLVGFAALEGFESGGKVAETFAILERKDAKACSWMMVVDR